MTEREKAAALKAVASFAARCGRMVPKFAEGSSQHTLLKHRIQALKIAEVLLSGGDGGRFSDDALSAAQEPLASIRRKCESARSKYPPGSGQYNRHGGAIRAMELSLERIENERHRRTL